MFIFMPNMIINWLYFTVGGNDDRNEYYECRGLFAFCQILTRKFKILVNDDCQKLSFVQNILTILLSIQSSIWIIYCRSMSRYYRSSF